MELEGLGIFGFIKEVEKLDNEADKQLVNSSAETVEGSLSLVDSEIIVEPPAPELPAAAPPLDWPADERVTHIELGGLRFNADYDSGNIARIVQRSDIEAATKWKEIQHANSPQPDFRSPTTSGTWRSLAQNATHRTPRPPALFTVWARADCEGTPVATRSRSWFAFSVRGASANRILQFEISELSTFRVLLRYAPASARTCFRQRY